MAKYNTTIYKEKKNPTYRALVPPKVMDALQERIMQVILLEKKYKDKQFSARKLANELGTNSRYVSAVVNVRFHMNYTSFINKFRIEEAKAILGDMRYRKLTMEEVADMVGFANRQSFYAAFYKMSNSTPRAYKLKAIAEQKAKEEQKAEEEPEDAKPESIPETNQ